MAADQDGAHSTREALQRDAERRARSSAPAETEASRDVANEDFLFHLYRGSELLQDNRILEAKSELEHALTLQPRDPKGQDLLAVVYFRIGLYPRAIQIYYELLRENPRDPALKLNLALCYLKTGQAQAAREELEAVVQANPAHKRAWGYLGLAFERLGDFDKALFAFERGGHTAMAKRMAERANRTRRTTIPPAAAPSPPSRSQTESVREAAAVAFEELDAGELSFALAAQEAPEEGTWHTVEPGAASPQHRSEQPPRMRPRYDTLDFGLPRSDSQVPAPTRPGMAPRAVADLARDAMLTFPRDRSVAILETGLALVQTEGAASPEHPKRDFAIRLEALRSYSGSPTTDVLVRQIRGQVSSETFGGVGSPMVSVSGTSYLVVGPRPSYRLVPFTLNDEVAFAREEHVFGFDLELAYENGRLAVGDGDAALMVQLRGTGTVILELMDPLAAIEVTGARPVNVRREVIVGWIGRLVPRALSLGEAPCGQRGLVSFSGEGTVLIGAK
jgi:hypothetical protein